LSTEELNSLNSFKSKQELLNNYKNEEVKEKLYDYMKIPQD
jgi:hypothetical protein